MTRATPRRLLDLSSDREHSVWIANEPPNRIASLKFLRIRVTLKITYYTHQVWNKKLVLERDGLVRVWSTTRTYTRKGYECRVPKIGAIVLRANDGTTSSVVLVYWWSAWIHTKISNDLTFIADTSPEGDAKTWVGPPPPVPTDEIAPLKVPFSNRVNDWTAPASILLTALRSK